LLVVVRFIPEKVYQPVEPARVSRDIVWLVSPGPGGGGGGGNRKPDPPKVAELKGADSVTVPAVQKPKPVPDPVPEPPVVEPQLSLPAQAMAAAATNIAIGAIASTSSSDSLGPGSSTGAGPGSGAGSGPGDNGGFGGDAYRPGNGVVSPVPVRQVRPSYTADAMRARAQGTVGLDCVVLPDGSVGPCDVVQPLDSAFGLDAEAVKAAKQWRFRPGTRLGEPVSVLVRIELTFTLR
jgi:TonB family protein